MFFGLEHFVPDVKAVLVEEEDIADLDVMWKIVNGFRVEEDVAGIVDRGGVDDFEFEAIVFFGVFSVRVGAIDNDPHCGELDLIGGFFLLDISKFGEVVLLVHKSDKIKNYCWAGSPNI